MKIHLVDGTYELFRSYFGAPPKKAPDGREVGATLGLLNSLLALLTKSGATHVACAFDHVVESFRNDLFPGYKTSAGVPHDLLAQFALAEQAVAAFGVVVWPMVEFEADDALASAARRFRSADGVDQVVIMREPTPAQAIGLTDQQTLHDTMIVGQQYIPLTANGYRCQTADLWRLLLAAAARRTTIEATCADLTGAPDANIVRGFLTEQLSPAAVPDLEQQWNDLLRALLPDWLRGRPQEIAVDFHDEPYSGRDDPEDDDNWVCCGEAHAGTTRFYRCATAYLMLHDVRLTLAVVFVIGVGVLDDQPLQPVRIAGEDAEADWPAVVLDEQAKADLGDARSNRRLRIMAAAFGAQPAAPINQASADWRHTKAADACFARARALPAAIVLPHQQRTRERMAAHAPRILASADTTLLNCSHHPATRGLGPIGGGHRGLVMHATRAFPPQGLPLGLRDQQMWARPAPAHAAKRTKQRPIADNERHTWRSALRAPVRMPPSAVRLITIADREADSCALLAEADELSAEYVIRAAPDRRLSGEAELLWAPMAQQAVVGTVTVAVAARGASRHGVPTGLCVSRTSPATTAARG